MARRRGTLNDEEDTDRWLVSYADFITLLFAFFVVMYSVSSVNLGKYRVLSDAMTSAFSSSTGMKIQPGEQLGISVQRAPISLGMENQYGRKAMNDTAAKIENKMKDWIKKGQIAVRGNEKWLEVEINTSILFASGSAALSPKASVILSGLGDIFKSSNNPLYVAGYTDNLPINTVQFPSNWELSSARAASVVRLFAEGGINPSRMGVIGFAEYRPAADNDSVDNRQKNRRVIIRMLAGEDMFADTTPFADSPVEAKTAVEQPAQSLQQGLQIKSLQPGEPARAFQ